MNLSKNLRVSFHQKEPTGDLQCGGVLIIVIEFAPSEFDPRNVEVVVKFVQVFHYEGLILALEINNSEASLFLWFASCFPGYKPCTFSVNVASTPQAMFSKGVNLLNHFEWNFQATHVECWDGE